MFFFYFTKSNLLWKNSKSISNQFKRGEQSIDITGQRFGKLVALNLEYTKPRGIEFWKFKCDCGNYKILRKTNVTRRKEGTKSCGCLLLENLTGQVFGRLTAIRYHHSTKSSTYWLWKCNCGNHKLATPANVKFGQVRSCGCLRKELQRRAKKHGCARTTKRHPLYHRWVSLRQRCNNSKDKSFFRYGGRGIQVCERWDSSFENFFNDMLSSYLQHIRDFGAKNTSLDRKDNNAGYSPKNCKWSTFYEQAQNRRHLKHEDRRLKKLRERAMGKIHYDLKKGLLVKRPCEICGCFRSEAHHLDYLKPCRVEWYCRKHHTELHKILRKLRAYSSTGRISVSKAEDPDSNSGRLARSPR